MGIALLDYNIIFFIICSLQEVAFIATDQLDNVLEYVTRDVEGM